MFLSFFPFKPFYLLVPLSVITLFYLLPPTQFVLSLFILLASLLFIHKRNPTKSTSTTTQDEMTEPPKTADEIDIVLPYEEERLQALKTNQFFMIHDNTPLDWLKDRIDQANKECPEKLKVVLLITGSLCPIHKMHLNALKVAGEYLEKHFNYNILGGFISPSNDAYVFGKLGEKAIPFVDRANMSRLAVEELDFKFPVVVDAWEGNIEIFMNYDYVRDHLSLAIRDKFPDEKILVLYVDGLDHFKKCRIGEWWYKVATVLRPEAPGSRTASVPQPVSIPEKFIYVCTDTNGENVSSTMIRDRINAGESIDDLTFHSVVKYLDKFYERKKEMSSK